MESLPSCPILEFKPDTLQYIRKQYELDKPERMNEAIDILEEWIKKQEHFEKKSFHRDYLERIIVFNKGLIEKCKKKLDRLCTLRTLIPDYFEMLDFPNRDFMYMFDNTFLPKMTPDYGRVHLIRSISKKYTTNEINLLYKYLATCCDYLQEFDYCNHLTFVGDFTNGNALNYAMAIDVVDLRKVADIIMNGTSMRVKAIHFVTPTKGIELLMSIFKPLLSPKIADRIHIHSSRESLYKFIPREIFPKDYDGDEKPMSELADDTYNEMNSSKFLELKKEMQQARTNEALRQTDKFNDEYMGVSGTFRTLKVD